MDTKTIVALIREAADRIEDGSCFLTSEQMNAIVGDILDVDIEEASRMTHLSVPTIRKRITGKEIRGRKRPGITKHFYKGSELRKLKNE